MKILMIEKFYFVKGGVERYMFDLIKLLEQNGHEVIPFSMKHERNESSIYSKYFVNKIEFNLTSNFAKIINFPRSVVRVIYSFHAKRKLRKLLRQVRPDVAHLHMIDHQISPSVIHVLKKNGIPIIQTSHHCKLFCPSYLCYIAHKNEICERCIDGKFYNAVLQRCHKHSLAASLLVSIESYLHRFIKIYDNIQYFHVPSSYMGRMLKKSGVDPKRISHQFLTLNLENYPFSPSNSGYYVYFGRLSVEKGVMSLLKAVEKLADSTPCYIIGEGPQREELEKYAEDKKLHQVKFLGYKHQDELREIVAKSLFVVVPSECYDNSPVTIYESYALGKPVIGSITGGIPEFIDDGQNGFLFEMGNVDLLAEKLKLMLGNPEKLQEFGLKVRQFAERHFSWDTHYKFILELYNKAISRDH